MPACSLETPIGALTVQVEADAVVAVAWGAAAEGADDPLLVEAAAQLKAYFAGRLSDFDLPLRPAGRPFQCRAWRAMRGIPYGETVSYGELAARLDSSARAVGGACRDNPIPVIVPCHRVLAAGGRLGGYSGGAGLATKRALLSLEGALAPELL